VTALIIVGVAAVVALAWWVSQRGIGGPAAAPPGSRVSTPLSESEVRRLLSAGDKIGAIKVYRELTGLGLKESKDAVDALESGRVLPSASSATPRVAGADAVSDAEILRLVQAGQLIEAIKRYRALTGVGLKEAKDAIEGLGR
jgi:ribosomal protein L7/L12